MKKLFALGLVGLIGCSATQWANFQSDPAAYIAVYEQDVQTFLTDASLIFTALLPLLGNNAGSAQAKFTTAVDAVNHAITALNAALKADQDANSDPANLVALQQDVTTAVENLEQVLTDLKAATGTVGASLQTGRWTDFETLTKTIASYGRATH